MVTGMQTAKQKADSQVRKAKVNPSTPGARWSRISGWDLRVWELTSLCNSLLIHIMSYWSMCYLFWALENYILTCLPLQRVLVERLAIGWKLYTWAFDWEGIFWQGLFSKP